MDTNNSGFSLYVDVISIEKTGEHFRLIYDVKGRFTVHRITAEEAKVRAQCPFLRKLPIKKKSSFTVLWWIQCKFTS